MSPFDYPYVFKIPTSGTDVPKVAEPGFCTVSVPALPSNSCLTATTPTPVEAEPPGVVTFDAVPVVGVTGAVAVIFTVIAGVALIGVDIDVWEIVRATTGLART